ncbi:type II secretion system protein [Pseudothauera lacus]|uniref:Prepilin-type N-terminal cleavage/methylation domain-containing protein n=1 Tax=Pseudothauera lacus TaxID=2136175 RepID=A0A2T4IIR6_9RHOO|nr:type II secretion system protein [Pseudothauera lacus]PTD97616.1 hypothetical protein C8261_02760 [Pseudothauera lacus]
MTHHHLQTSSALRRHPHSGFSLIEMAVVLAIIGTIGLGVWRLLPLIGDAAVNSGAAHTQLERAELALTGFARLHGRLPCPDVNGDGVEECGTTEQVGWLPVRTLGIVLPDRLRYGVSRQTAGAGDLAAAVARHTPRWPDGTTGTIVNGLDFCAGLRSAAREPGAAAISFSSGAPLAFAVAHPGSLDADNDGNLFDGDNRSASTFTDPTLAHSPIYDDHTRGLGFTTLAARLGCVEKLAAAHAAHRTAWADHDHYQVALAYETFRAFGVEVRSMNREMAIADVTVASIDLVMATATSLTAISVSISAVGSAAPAAAAAVIAVGAATTNTVFAGISLDNAIEALAKASSQHSAATAYRQRAALQAAASLARARRLDHGGLQ